MAHSHDYSCGKTIISLQILSKHFQLSEADSDGGATAGVSGSDDGHIDDCTVDVPAGSSHNDGVVQASDYEPEAQDDDANEYYNLETYNASVQTSDIWIQVSAPAITTDASTNTDGGVLSANAGGTSIGSTAK